jgi:isopenicillin N synthase-like dioxygenase
MIGTECSDAKSPGSQSVRILDGATIAAGTTPDVSSPAFAVFAKAFCTELETIGLCGIRNCGITNEQIAKLNDVGRRFFASDPQFKQTLDMKNAGAAWRGYFSTGKELTAGLPDLKEGLYFGADHAPAHPLVKSQEPMHGSNQWPPNDLGAEMRTVVTSYMAAATQVCHNLMQAIAVGLGCQPNIFDDLTHPEPTTLFRIFNYPPKELNTHVGSQWGVAEHTDMGFLTLLLQGGTKTALEVKTRDGKWIDVPPEPGAFYVNIGDMLEYWSQGLLWATPHRVRESAGEGRLSFPFFFDPAWKANIRRVKPEILASRGWSPADRLLRTQSDRWDRLQLHSLEDMDYGTFVWSKIRNVFPCLASEITNKN